MTTLVPVLSIALICQAAVTLCSARMIESSAVESSAAVSTPYLTFVQIWPVSECLVREMAYPHQCDLYQAGKTNKMLIHKPPLLGVLSCLKESLFRWLMV